MRIGQLRHPVELQKFINVQDELGNQIEEWTTVATVWAAVEPVSGKEYWEARMLQAETTVKVTLRYRPGLNPVEYRLVFRGEIYEIESIINLEGRDRLLQLMCKKKEGQSWTGQTRC